MFKKKLIIGEKIIKAVEVFSLLGKKDPYESVEQLANSFSKDCDGIIIKTLKEDANLKYISGLFKMKLDEEKMNVLVAADLYFQTVEEQWVKKENHSKVPVTELVESAVAELAKAEEVAFEINLPRQLQKEDVQL